MEKMNIKKYLQFTVNLGITVNSMYPVTSTLARNLLMGKISLLHRESLASPLSVVLTAPPKTLLGSNFSAKFPLEVLKEALFRHRSAAWPWGFPETHRQCSCCVMRCTVLPSRCKNILVAKSMAFSLSSHWMLEQPSLPFCSLSVQAQQGTHQQQQKWDLQGWEFHSSWGKSLPKYLSQPLPSTARGTAACSAPRRAKSLPGLGRAPGWLGSLVTSPFKSCPGVSDERLDLLPFLQQEPFSHRFPTCHSRTEPWPILSYLLFWGTEGSFRGTVPFGISFLRLDSTAICCAVFVDP